MGVMFNKMGGLPTNAGGAVLLDRLIKPHQQLMATDPEYRGWFDKHPTLMFAAAMMLPITPDSMGVSLNPIMRDILTGGSRKKAFWDIGPIYTVNHLIRPIAGEIGADLYQSFGDVPFVNSAFAATTGQDLTGYAP
jgi:hypothetical protein